MPFWTEVQQISSLPTGLKICCDRSMSWSKVVVFLAARRLALSSPLASELGGDLNFGLT